ncbi:Ms4533A family Cys-rich leader peptide [Mycobacterium deserti]|uniref:Ms4533A family Cys-rich leader peptide n=1 Tax=Mycobacterium deserti TaxID=2978347 RepID=UPI0036F3CF68
MGLRWYSTARWATASGCCTGRATPRRTSSERAAAIAGDAGARPAGGAGHRRVAADALTDPLDMSGLADSVILPAMQTASGNKSGHILALIAVGFSAVADVCCCR